MPNCVISAEGVKLSGFYIDKTVGGWNSGESRPERVPKVQVRFRMNLSGKRTEPLFSILSRPFLGRKLAVVFRESIHQI
jgi:hypothetical protein